MEKNRGVTGRGMVKEPVEGMSGRRKCRTCKGDFRRRKGNDKIMERKLWRNGDGNERNGEGKGVKWIQRASGTGEGGKKLYKCKTECDDLVTFKIDLLASKLVQ